MVMVETNSNAILVDPLKICNDADLKRAYRTKILRSKRSGIVPRKQILDNKVLGAMKTIIRDE